MRKVSQDFEPIDKCLTILAGYQTLNQIFPKQHLQSFHREIVDIFLSSLIIATSNSKDCDCVELAGLQGILEVFKV